MERTLMGAHANQPVAAEDRSIDPVGAIWLAIGSVLSLLGAAIAPYLALHGSEPLLTAWDQLSLWMFVAVLLVGSAAHEGLHALTWLVAGKLRYSDLRFGINWRTLAPFAHSRAPLPVNAYRIGVVMPGLVLGLVPVVMGTALGWPLLTLFAAILLAAAAGDLVVLFLLRHDRSPVMVQDHPTRWGCTIVAPR